MKTLLAVSLLAASSVRAASLAELKALAGSAELPDVPSISARPVGGPAEFAGLKSAPSLNVLGALAAETESRGECRMPSDDPDWPHNTSVYCTAVIDEETGFWGGHRAYVAVIDGRSIRYHKQTPDFIIGHGALTGQELRAVRTVSIEASADGSVRSISRSHMTLVGSEADCRGRADSFLVRGHDRDRSVTVCTHRETIPADSRSALVEQAVEEWRAALRKP